MLESLMLPQWANLNCNESGIDCLNACKNKNWFLNYPFDISYSYNTRGFRDEEWPTENLENNIWCIGDSFTVGLGSPINHTWVKVLENKSQIRTINISMDGASNHWITNKALKIFKEVSPKNVVIMFSYLHRRQLPNNLPDIQRRLRFIKYETFEDDLINFKWCIESIEKHKSNTNVIYLAVPYYVANENKKDVNVTLPNFLGEVEILDYARDYHHFDLKTSESIVERIIPLLAK